MACVRVAGKKERGRPRREDPARAGSLPASGGASRPALRAQRAPHARPRSPQARAPRPRAHGRGRPGSAPEGRDRRDPRTTSVGITFVLSPAEITVAVAMLRKSGSSARPSSPSIASTRPVSAGLRSGRRASFSGSGRSPAIPSSISRAIASHGREARGGRGERVDARDRRPQCRGRRSKDDRLRRGSRREARTPASRRPGLGRRGDRGSTA